MERGRWVALLVERRARLSEDRVIDESMVQPGLGFRLRSINRYDGRWDRFRWDELWEKRDFTFRFEGYLLQLALLPLCFRSADSDHSRESLKFPINNIFIFQYQIHERKCHKMKMSWKMGWHSKTIIEKILNG